jgi:hypothetical protein
MDEMIQKVDYKLTTVLDKSLLQNRSVGDELLGPITDSVNFHIDE